MKEHRRDEHVVWQAFPSWWQFVWLFMFAALAVLRGGLSLAFGLPTWGAWLMGALALLGAAALIRKWARYVITTEKVAITNGYTGKEIESIALDKIQSTSVSQGPIAGFLGIGTLVIRGTEGEHSVRFRGIQDSEVVQRRLDALRPASSSA